MAGKSMAILVTVAALSLVALTDHVAYAQTTGTSQLAANKDIAAAGSVNRKDGPSPEALEEQIKAQQLEIDELRARLKKLEGVLEVVAANQTARPRDTTAVEPVAAEIATNTGATAMMSGASDSLSSTASNSASPNPPAAPVAPQATRRELLPDIGQIGAQVGLLVGFAQNPFESDSGFLGGGYIDLPLKKVRGGKISYEILAGLQRAKTQTQTTSAVNALVNSVLNRELGNPPSVNNLFGPLPLTNNVEERQTVLTVVPFSLKYTVTALDRHNVRPYVVAGLGTYVTLSTQNTTNFDANQFVGTPAVANVLNSLLNGPQVAGLIPAAPELRARGQAAGQGDFRFGLNVGGGIDFRITPKLSFGFDYRFNRIEGSNGSFSTLTAKPLTINF